MKFADKCWLCVLLVAMAIIVVLNFSVADTYAATYCDTDHEKECNQRTNLCYWCLDECLPMEPCNPDNIYTCNGLTFIKGPTVTCDQYQEGYSMYVLLFVILVFGTVAWIIVLAGALSYGVNHTEFGRKHSRFMTQVAPIAVGVLLVVIANVVSAQYSTAVPPGPAQLFPMMLFAVALFGEAGVLVFVLVRSIHTRLQTTTNAWSKVWVPAAVSGTIVLLSILLMATVPYVSGWLGLTSTLQGIDLFGVQLAMVLADRKPDRKPYALQSFMVIFFLLIALVVQRIDPGASRVLWALACTFYACAAAIRLRNDEFERTRNRAMEAAFADSELPDDDDSGVNGDQDATSADHGNNDQQQLYQANSAGVAVPVSQQHTPQQSEQQRQRQHNSDLNDEEDGMCAGFDLQLLLVVLITIMFSIIVFVPHENWNTQIGLTSLLAYIAIVMMSYGSYRRRDNSLLVVAVKSAMERPFGRGDYEPVGAEQQSTP